MKDVVIAYPLRRIMSEAGRNVDQLVTSALGRSLMKSLIKAK